MKIPFRFTIRSLLILVALTALVIGFGTTLWRRHQFNAAIEATLAVGPDYWRESGEETLWSSDSFPRLVSYKESAKARLLEVLLANVETDQRRLNALSTLDLPVFAESFEDRRRLLPEFIELAVADRVSRDVERALAHTIAEWIPCTGVSPDLRQAILKRAKSVEPELRAAWLGVLLSIGGREETLLVLEYADSEDPNLVDEAIYSNLISANLPELLPHVKRWLYDPNVEPYAAGYVMMYSVLDHTSAGREILLDYLADNRNPVERRRRAVEALTQTLAGAELLQSACEDETLAVTLSYLLTIDIDLYLNSTLERLRNFNGDDLWNQLIDALNPEYVFPDTTQALTKDEKEFWVRRHREVARQSLKSLRILSGNAELSTHQEWREWLSSANPGAYEQSELMQVLLENPELQRELTLVRRIVPYWIGDMPEDCVPIYEQMLRSEERHIRYYASLALLTYTDSDEAVNSAIDLIERTNPDDLTPSPSSGPFNLLSDRYAVNFFWDIDAWRAWAEKRHADSENE